MFWKMFTEQKGILEKMKSDVSFNLKASNLTQGSQSAEFYWFEFESTRRTGSNRSNSNRKFRTANFEPGSDTTSGLVKLFRLLKFFRENALILMLAYNTNLANVVNGLNALPTNYPTLMSKPSVVAANMGKG